MKHIVIVVGMYKNGGVERRTTTLANQFAKRGYKCTILVLQEMSSEKFFKTEENVEIVLLSDYAQECRVLHKDSAEKKIIKQIQLLKKIQHTTTIFKKLNRNISEKIKLLRGGQVLANFVSNNPQSIYIPFGCYCMSCLYAASQGYRIKKVYAEMNSPDVSFAGNSQKIKQFLHIVSKVQGAVMQTREEKDFFSSCLKNTIVIHNPVKSGLPEPYSGERRPVVVNFCRISEQKNLFLLINAFSVFKASHPNFVLEIYGNTISEEEEKHLTQLKQYVQSKGLEDTVFFLPPRADVHNLIKDCAMFVSSSDYEGLSNSMLEALAIGLPCVCTDCLGGGARELINNGENGLLVPVKDVNALASAMSLMVDDKDLSPKCSANASKIRYELTPEKIAGEWLEYIEKVI